MARTQSKPKDKGQDAGPTKADKAMDEVREVHDNIRRKWQTHERTEITREVETDEGDLEVRTVDGKCYLTVDGHEVVLDREGVIDLRRNLEAAFQAVS